jgi:hypothetical protein
VTSNLESFGGITAQERNFAQDEECASFFGVEGVGAFEGFLGGGEVGRSAGKHGAEDAPLLEGAVALRIDALEFIELVERAVWVALAGEAEAKVVVGIFVRRVQEGLEEEGDGFGVVVLDLHGVHRGTLLGPEIERALLVST